MEPSSDWKPEMFDHSCSIPRHTTTPMSARSLECDNGHGSRGAMPPVSDFDILSLNSVSSSLLCAGIRSVIEDSRTDISGTVRGEKERGKKTKNTFTVLFVSLPTFVVGALFTPA